MQDNLEKVNTTNKEQKPYDRFIVSLDALEIMNVSDGISKFSFSYIKEHYQLINGIENKEQGKYQYFRVDESITLKKEFSIYNAYDDKYHVYIDKKYVAILLMSSRKNEKLIKLKIVNEILYRDDYLAYLDKIYATLPIRYSHTHYLEISYDSLVNTTEMFDSYYQNSNKRAYSKTKRYLHKTSSTVSTLEDGKTFIIGKQPSKKIVLYNKSAELEKSGKEYIKQLYELNCLNGEVHRVEARLKREYLIDYDNCKDFLTWLQDNDFIKSIFVKACGWNLTFKDSENGFFDEHRNKKFEEIHIIDLDKVSQIELDVIRIKQKPVKKKNADNKINDITKLILDEVKLIENGADKAGEAKQTIEKFKTLANELTRKAIHRAASLTWFNDESALNQIDDNQSYHLFKISNESKEILFKRALEMNVTPDKFLEKIICGQDWLINLNTRDI